MILWKRDWQRERMSAKLTYWALAEVIQHHWRTTCR
jgi:hypothetical protein